MLRAPPELDLFKAAKAWTREPRLVGTSYSRMTLVNATTMMFEQVANDNGTVVDAFTVLQRRKNRSAPFEHLVSQYELQLPSVVVI